MSRGREKKYSHMVCKECKSQNYEIMETRCNKLSFDRGFLKDGKAGYRGHMAQTSFFCLDCGYEQNIQKIN